MKFLQRHCNRKNARGTDSSRRLSQSQAQIVCVTIGYAKGPSD